MPKTPLALLIALSAVACTQPPDEPTSPPERALAKATAAADDGPGFFESVEQHGSGCEGTAASAISPDKQAVTTTFSEFLVAAGPGTAAGDASRNCLLMMHINVPAGWSYSLESVDIRGFVSLQPGVTASRRSLYLISGSPVHVTPPARFKGEITDDYNQPDVSPQAPGEWSPCAGGQVLWVAAQTDIDNRGRKDAEGELTVDAIDTELQWRRCQ
jgi:hypothetical protein